MPTFSMRRLLLRCRRHATLFLRHAVSMPPAAPARCRVTSAALDCLIFIFASALPKRARRQRRTAARRSAALLFMLIFRFVSPFFLPLTPAFFADTDAATPCLHHVGLLTPDCFSAFAFCHRRPQTATSH
jgi:hypothetical protein